MLTKRLKYAKIMRIPQINGLETTMKKILDYFTRTELFIWLTSVGMITLSFLIFENGGFLTLIASIIGVTSIMINAKGNPLGQLLMIFFSLIYGYISYSFAYYGEMMTYLGMTMPMAVFSLAAWLKNPFNGNRSEVKVNTVSKNELCFLGILTIAVTVVFFFILRHFGTANLIPSTFSVTTSFIAVYLTFRRSAYFSIAYAANDTVLIVLWLLAARSDRSYISVVICFVMFLVNDIYAFKSWLKMKDRQSAAEPQTT